MRNTKVFAKIFGLVMVWLVGFLWYSFADIVFPNTHPVHRCVKIQENPNLMGDDRQFTLKAKITWPMVEWDEEDYAIRYDSCLSAGYKMNDLHVILQKDNQEYDLWGLATWWGYNDDANPINGEMAIYQITKENGEYQLEKIFENESIHFVLFDKDNPHATFATKHDEKNPIISKSKIFDEEFLGAFVVALLLTIVVESIVLLMTIKWLLRKYFINQKISRGKVIFAGIFCSLATLPYLWCAIEFFYRLWGWRNQEIIILLWEITVVLVEAIMLKYILDISRKKALLLSFTANALSFLSGLGLIFLIN